MKTKVSPKDSKKDHLRTTKDKARTKYSPDQLRALEGLFISCQYPDTEVLQALSDKLTVSIEKVSIWFQNRRAKFKRQSKPAHTAWMRQQFYTQDNVIRPTQGADREEHVLSPPEVQTDGRMAALQLANSHYGPIEGLGSGQNSELFSRQQQQQYSCFPELVHNQKQPSLNDFINELSQTQYGMNYSSQSVAYNQSQYPANYAGSYPGLYYPYSAYYPSGSFPPIGV